jgi:hypothetical protein
MGWSAIYPRAFRGTIAPGSTTTRAAVSERGWHAHGFSRAREARRAPLVKRVTGRAA